MPGTAGSGQYQMHSHSLAKACPGRGMREQPGLDLVTLRQVLDRAGQWVAEGRGIAIESFQPGLCSPDDEQYMVRLNCGD